MAPPVAMSSGSSARFSRLGNGMTEVELADMEVGVARGSGGGASAASGGAVLPRRRSPAGTLALGAALAMVAIGLLAWVLGAGSRPSAVDLPAFESSPLDVREYGAIELANGLRVALVSDPSAALAAGAVDVHVGSQADPRNTSGLAHFLEHMMFQGSERFPGNGAYMEWLSAREGSSNAYTAGEDTNYYFEVEAASLGGALSRLGSQFEAPLLAAEASAKEVNAVNNEHVKNLNSDSWRQWMLLKALSVPGGEWQNFGTGDASTLAGAVAAVGAADGDDVLRRFFETHYSAERMTACIAGPQPLGELRALAVEHLSAIPARPTGDSASDALLDAKAARERGPDVFGPAPEEDRSGGGGFSFPPYELRTSYLPAPKVVYTKSISDRSLALVWAVPGRADSDAGAPFGKRHYDYDSLTVPFLQSVLDATHEGSASAALQAANLAYGATFSVDQYDDWAFCQLEVRLTPQGVRRHTAVAATVLAYLGAFHNAAAEDLTAAFSTYQRAAEAQWKYTYNVKELGTLVFDASEDMQLVPHRRVLGSPMGAEYNEDVVRAYISAMKPAKMVMLLAAPDALRAAAADLELIEPIYGSAFWQRPLAGLHDAELLHEAWQGGKYTLLGKELTMTLPPPNPYVPSDADASIVAPKGSDGTPSRLQECAGVGAQVEACSSDAVVWLAPNAARSTSQLFAKCVVNAPGLAWEVAADGERFEQVSLRLDAAFSDVSKAVAGLASQAGVGVSWGRAADGGVVISASGAALAAERALSDYVAALVSHKPTPADALRAALGLLSSVETARSQPLFRQYARLTEEVLQEKKWLLDQVALFATSVRHAAEANNTEALSHLLPGIFTGTPQVDCFAYGNVDEVLAARVSASVVQGVSAADDGAQRTKRPQHRGQRVLPVGDAYVRLPHPAEQIDGAPPDGNSLYVSLHQSDMAGAQGSPERAMDRLAHSYLVSQVSKRLAQQIRARIGIAH